MSSGLLDTEPGGESNQYESIKTIDVPSKKQTGQLGDETAIPPPDSQQTKRGEKTAENIKYGQNISESGMGGMTTDIGGQGNEDAGFGGAGAQNSSEFAVSGEGDQKYSTEGEADQDSGYGGPGDNGAVSGRRKQGYEEAPNVGG